MKNKITGLLASLMMLLSLGLLAAGPAAAAAYTIQNGCTVVSGSKYMYAYVPYTTTSTHETYGTIKIVGAGASEYRVSIRNSLGNVIAGPVSVYNPGTNDVWITVFNGYSYTKSMDTRVRIYYYSNAGGCNRVYNPSGA